MEVLEYDDTADDGWEEDDELLEDLLDVDLVEDSPPTEDEKKESEDEQHQDVNTDRDNLMKEPIASGLSLLGKTAAAVASRGILSTAMLASPKFHEEPKMDQQAQNVNDSSTCDSNTANLESTLENHSGDVSANVKESTMEYRGGLLINSLTRFFDAAQSEAEDKRIDDDDDDYMEGDGWDDNADDLFDDDNDIVEENQQDQSKVDEYDHYPIVDEEITPVDTDQHVEEEPENTSSEILLSNLDQSEPEGGDEPATPVTPDASSPNERETQKITDDDVSLQENVSSLPVEEMEKEYEDLEGAMETENVETSDLKGSEEKNMSDVQENSLITPTCNSQQDVKEDMVETVEKPELEQEDVANNMEEGDGWNDDLDGVDVDTNDTQGETEVSHEIIEDASHKNNLSSPACEPDYDKEKGIMETVVELESESAIDDMGKDDEELNENNMSAPTCDNEHDRKEDMVGAKEDLDNEDEANENGWNDDLDDVDMDTNDIKTETSRESNQAGLHENEFHNTEEKVDTKEEPKPEPEDVDVVIGDDNEWNDDLDGIDVDSNTAEAEASPEINENELHESNFEIVEESKPEKEDEPNVEVDDNGWNDDLDGVDVDIDSNEAIPKVETSPEIIENELHENEEIIEKAEGSEDKNEDAIDDMGGDDGWNDDLDDFDIDTNDNEAVTETSHKIAALGREEDTIPAINPPSLQQPSEQMRNEGRTTEVAPETEALNDETPEKENINDVVAARNVLTDTAATVSLCDDVEVAGATEKLKEKEEWNLEASNGFNLDNANKQNIASDDGDKCEVPNEASIEEICSEVLSDENQNQTDTKDGDNDFQEVFEETNLVHSSPSKCVDSSKVENMESEPTCPDEEHSDGWDNDLNDLSFENALVGPSVGENPMGSSKLETLVEAAFKHDDNAFSTSDSDQKYEEEKPTINAEENSMQLPKNTDNVDESLKPTSESSLNSSTLSSSVDPVSISTSDSKKLAFKDGKYKAQSFAWGAASAAQSYRSRKKDRSVTLSSRTGTSVMSETPSYYLDQLIPQEPVTTVTECGKSIKIDYAKLLQNEIAKRILMEKELASHLERVSYLEQELIVKDKDFQESKESHCKLEQSLKNQRKVMDDENAAWNLERRKMESDMNSVQQSLSKAEQNLVDERKIQVQKLDHLENTVKFTQAEKQQVEATLESEISRLTKLLQDSEVSVTTSNKLSQEMISVKAKLESKSQYCDELSSKITSLQQSLNNSKVSIYDITKVHEKEMKEMKSLLERKEEEQKKLEAEHKYQIADLMEKLEESKQSPSESPEVIELETKLASETQRCNEMNTKVAALEQSLSKAELESFDVAKKHARKIREMERLIQASNGKEQLAVKEIESQLKEAQSHNERLVAERNASRNDAVATNQLLNEKSKIVLDLEMQIKEMKTETEKNKLKESSTVTELKSRYESQIQHLKEDSEKWKREWNEQNALLNQLQGNLKSLTLERNQANQSKGAMKNEIDDLKVTVQKLEHESKLVENNLSIKYDSLMEEKNQLEVDFEELLVQMGLEKETAAEEIEEYENQVMELETELETQMKENSDLREELNAKKITDQQMQRQETELAAQEMLSKQLQTLSQSNSDLQNKVKQLSDSQASLSAELDEMKSDCNKKDDQIQQLSAKNIELSGQVDHLQMTVDLIDEPPSTSDTTSNDEWENRYHSINEILTDRTNEVNALKLALEEAKAAMNSTNENYTAAHYEDQTNVIKQKDEQIADLLEREQQATKKLAEVEMRSSTDDQEKQNLQNQLTDTNKMYEEARKEMNQMRDQIDKMEIDLLSSELELNAKDESSENYNYIVEVEDLKRAISKKDNEILDLQLNIESMKSTLIASQVELAEQKLNDGGENNSINDVVEKYDEEMIELKEKIHMMEMSLTEKEDNLRESTSLMEAMTNDLQALQEILGDKDEEIHSLLEKVNELEAKLQNSQTFATDIPEAHSKNEAESVDFMREQIIFLANALEQAEMQRADAMERILMERKANADTIKRVKDSIKRFYSTLSCSESAP